MTATVSQVSGYMAMAGSFFILYGLFRQILLNRRRGRVEGLHPSLICAALYTYTTWAIHGWSVPNWYLAATQTPGAILALILVIQWWRDPTRSKRRL
jgi:hypothetical protein